MTALTYDEHETLREARARYWAANGFGDDGGYTKTWEIVKLGPLPIPIRNIEARKKTIRFHDLHHLVTGYDTDLAGEAEISAWELAAGCSDKWVARLLGFQILPLGLATPKRMLRAWARGRRTRCLYAEPFDDALLEHTVAEMRQTLGLDQPQPTPGPTDLLGLGVATLMSLLLQLGGLLTVLGSLWWAVSLAVH